MIPIPGDGIRDGREKYRCWDQGVEDAVQVLKTNLRTRKVIPRGRTTKIPQKPLFEDV